MSVGRYGVDAVLLEGRSPAELARQHRISRSWIYQLVARFREGGYDALEPRSRRPRSCSHQVDAETEATILRLRQGLIDDGHDAGAQTNRPPPAPIGSPKSPLWPPSGASSPARAWLRPSPTSALAPPSSVSRLTSPTSSG